MSTALLQELYQEVRRIYIAGSELAVEDFRLKRLQPSFEKLGERAPVFKRIGECIQELISRESQVSQSSAEKLQDLGLLLSSVLKTLGTTGDQGECRDIENIPHSLTTHLSYRKLALVQEALTTTGSGRYEVVKDAYEAGMFHDLRLLPYAIRALSDPYSEIAELAEKSILPSYGEEIIPHLKTSFEACGGKVQARTLGAIAAIGGKGVSELLIEAAHSGSDDVKVVAIRHLGAYDQYDEELFGFAAAKKKALREAAYDALSQRGSDQAIERIYEAFSGKDMETALTAVQQCDSPKLTDMIVEGLNSELKLAEELKGDKKKSDQLWQRVQYFLRALYDKQSPALEELFSGIIDQYTHYMKYGWLELYDQAAIYIEENMSADGLSKLQALEKANPRYMPHAFRMSHAYLTPAELYERYAPILSNKANTLSAKDAQKFKESLIETIQDMIYSREYAAYSLPDLTIQNEIWLSSVIIPPANLLADNWDERWLDVFVEAQAFDLVCAFARPGHKGAEHLLLSRAHMPPKRVTDFASKLLQGLIRVGVQEEQCAEILIGLLESKNCDLFDKLLVDYLKKLAPEYLDQLIAVQSKSSMYSTNLLLQHIINHLEMKHKEETTA